MSEQFRGLDRDMQNSKLRLEAAKVHAKAGRPDEAIALYEAVLEENPEVTAAYIGIASILLERNEVEAAEDYFNGALHVARNPAPVLCRIAMAAERMADTERAASLYQQSLQEDPGFSRARERLCRLYIDADDLTAAEQLMRDALASDLATIRSRLLLAQVLSRQGQLNEAIDVLEHITEDGEDTVRAQRLKGALMLRVGRAEEAADVFAQVAEMSDEKPIAEFQRGQALLQIGDFRAAKRAFQAALARSPGLFEARLGLARCHLRSGNTSAAKHILVALSQGQRGLHRVLFLLAEVFAAEGHFQQAAVQLDAGFLHAPHAMLESAGLLDIAAGSSLDKEKTLTCLKAIGDLDDAY
ncbi:MAG: tetratricopeptide repeat protein [Chromatiaceae bacterium]|nr:tetratricopeptide repeat protein [Chromatiaceae bacterium]